MSLFFRKILLICLCIFVHGYTIGQVNFYAELSPFTINKNDLATYRIILVNPPANIQNISAPSFKDLVLVERPMQQFGKSNINGHVSTYISVDYILKPKRTGNIKIDPAKATVEGKNLTSNGVVLKVVNALSPHNNSAVPFFAPDVYSEPAPAADFSDYIFHKGDNVAEKVNKNMQLKLDVNKTSCYVGEPVIASFKLYTRLKSDSKLTQNPSFNGFSVVDMQQPGFNDYSREKLNGKEYNVYTIRKSQIYALQPGTINIEPAEVENNIKFIKEEYAKKAPDAERMFNDFAAAVFPADAIVNQTVVLKNTPVDIIVKPLPDENKPKDFNGAVGKFEMNAALQKPLFSTDEAGKLTITITGSGNMQLLTAPEITWQKGIEAFEPKFSDQLNKATVPVSGIKKFEYSFAANDTGHFMIAPIHFSYFDPAIETYQSIHTDSINFQVTKGTGHPLASSIKIIPRPSFINRIFYHRWWIIVFIAALMVTGLVIWLLRERKQKDKMVPVPATLKTEEEINTIIEESAFNQQNVFSETEKCLYQDDCFGFYTLLNTELKTYLSNKFSLDHNAINAHSIITILDKKDIPNEIVLKLQAVMQAIEWQLYTPFERNEKMNELYQEAHDVVQMINTQTVRHL